jgi:putative NADH-flavin reductase
MKLFLVGASGSIGSRILKEALSRGHQVTAVARHLPETETQAGLTWVQADVKDIQNSVKLAKGCDVLVSSLSPRAEGGERQYLQAVQAILEVVCLTEIGYVLFVGGASCLEVAPGQRVLDVKRQELLKNNFMEPFQVAEALDKIAASEVNWTFFCPAGMIRPGQRTGEFRLGGRQPLSIPEGQVPTISMEDYAVAVLDEMEQPVHQRQIFNIAY